jgi:hypothetical protein
MRMVKRWGTIIRSYSVRLEASCKDLHTIHAQDRTRHTPQALAEAAVALLLGPALVS